MQTASATVAPPPRVSLRRFDLPDMRGPAGYPVAQQGQRGSFLGGSGNVGGSMGASGGTGALGQMPVGSAVDKLRSSLQSVGQTNFLKGNYAGRGPI